MNNFQLGFCFCRASYDIAYHANNFARGVCIRTVLILQKKAVETISFSEVIGCPEVKNEIQFKMVKPGLLALTFLAFVVCFPPLDNDHLIYRDLILELVVQVYTSSRVFPSRDPPIRTLSSSITALSPHKNFQKTIVKTIAIFLEQ